MVKTERCCLFSIRIDGSESLPPYILTKDRLLFGRGESCDIQIEVDGVDLEHCVLTIDCDGNAFVQPISKSDNIFVNGLLVEKKVGLEHNDVITIVKRSFRFAYSVRSDHYQWGAKKECLVKPLQSKTKQKFYSTRKSLPTAGLVCNQAETGSSSILGSKRKSLDSNFNYLMDSVKEKAATQKRVTFGPRLSPEEFDKNLPPSTPVRKGSLPDGKIKLQIMHSSETSPSVLSEGFKDSGVLQTQHTTDTRMLFSDVKKPVSGVRRILSAQKIPERPNKRKFSDLQKEEAEDIFNMSKKNCTSDSNPNIIKSIEQVARNDSHLSQGHMQSVSEDTAENVTACLTPKIASKICKPKSRKLFNLKEYTYSYLKKF